MCEVGSSRSMMDIAATTSIGTGKNVAVIGAVIKSETLHALSNCSMILILPSYLASGGFGWFSSSGLLVEGISNCWEHF